MRNREGEQMLKCLLDTLSAGVERDRGFGRIDVGEERSEIVDGNDEVLVVSSADIFDLSLLGFGEVAEMVEESLGLAGGEEKELVEFVGGVAAVCGGDGEGFVTVEKPLEIEWGSEEQSGRIGHARKSPRTRDRKRNEMSFLMKPRMESGKLYLLLLGTAALSLAMFIPSAEALDISYFISRYVWNPDDENVSGGSDFDDMTETRSISCSSGSCYTQDEDNVGAISDLSGKARLFLVLPVALLDAFFILWIFTSLSATLNKLQFDGLLLKALEYVACRSGDSTER
ncbi:unnamed protein product [Camellia sinensis]